MPEAPPQAEAATPYQPQAPGKKKFWTDDKIIDGLKMANGNVSEACVMLRQKYNHKIGRSTVYDAITASPAVHDVWVQAEGQLYDVCRFGITKRAEAGNPRDQRLVFGKLSKKHGGDEPAPSHVIVTGPDGKPVQHQHEVIADGEFSWRKRIAALDDDALAELLKAVQIINGTRPATSGEHLAQPA